MSIQQTTPWYKSIEGLTFVQEYPSSDPNLVLVLYSKPDQTYVTAVLDRTMGQDRCLTIRDQVVCDAASRLIFQDIVNHSQADRSTVPASVQHIRV